MSYEWPDLTFPPINLWNVPKQNILRSGVALKTMARPKPTAQVPKRETLRRLLNAR